MRRDDQSFTRSCAICCDVAAAAVRRVSLESLPDLRRNPGPCYRDPLLACFLKHADEQTVVGLCAVYQAIQNGHLQATDFRDWGVLAAPRFLGRPAMATALQRFAVEGAWGVSPHLIPHRSLHSISGTVSQALKIHGPNFGVGGGPGGAVEVLLAATALLESKQLPGVWVVLTCLDPELPPEETGRMAAGTHAVGLALALTPIRMRGSRVRLQIVRGTPDAETLASAKRHEGGRSGFDLLRLESLLNLLHGSRGGKLTLVQMLDAHSRLELIRSGGAGTADMGGSSRVCCPGRLRLSVSATPQAAWTTAEEGT
ncbi:MAG TPA: hypothetical protein VMG10_03325 [Gemmataceae bacterium]|nr:hypothetical protein [Gemmataceae bacterium]